jgi:cobalt/nickel transport system ATP-binding protein
MTERTTHTDAPPLLALRSVGFAYPGGAPVLREVSFTLAAGEKAVILGANGCGKTTLLKIADGLLAPGSGACAFLGTALTRAALSRRAFARDFRRRVGLLFQNPDAMLFNPTVSDEIAFGLRQLGGGDVEPAVRSWAECFGLTRYLEQPPFQLSSGEKKKVCLAALLALEPELLLLDEPTANLDPRTTAWLVELLAGLPLALLIATHNLSLAAELATRALVLSEEHTLIYDGTVEALLADREVLITANLMHRHAHRHGEREHRHYHLHEWD